MAGQPPKYKSVEELEKKIDFYFKACPDKRTIHYKEGSIEVPHPTISGLAYYLGFASRQSMYDYENHKEYSYTIKRARLFIEKIYETLLMDNPTGAIFALKNLGWKDVVINENVNYNTEIEVQSEDSKNTIKKILDKFDSE